MAKLWTGVIKRIQFAYEGRVAPVVARYIFILYWPLYKLCKYLDVCFVVNIESGAGHTSLELDNFFLMRYLKEIDENKRYVWIKSNDPLIRTCMQLYHHKFTLALSSTWVYDLILPMLMRYREITIDVGLSRLKYQLREDLKFFLQKRCTHLYEISKAEWLLIQRDNYKRQQASLGYYPLREHRNANADELLKFLGKKGSLLALIHIKDVLRNSIAEPLDCKTYMESLVYLQGLGYQLVLVGREKMPEAFLQFNILNYAESNIASFKNDLLLFGMANIAIVCASGVVNLADRQNTPSLYLNFWHIGTPTCAQNSVCVPALVSKKTGQFLTFQEQHALYKSLPDIGSETFPYRDYVARNASSDEVLAGLKEVIELKDRTVSQTALQKGMKALDYDAPISYAMSRYSEYFLNKHRHLFQED
ncbi:MAG: TIGR04372 family glycosyltransferase [Chlamydiales bacterium]|nr:TIGR04372 family glycosyltransferase [Chlamydiales bacterium]